MLKIMLTAATVMLFSSAVMAQSTDTKAPAATGPAAQSDNMTWTAWKYAMHDAHLRLPT